MGGMRTALRRLRLAIGSGALATVPSRKIRKPSIADGWLLSGCQGSVRQFGFRGGSTATVGSPQRWLERADAQSQNPARLGSLCVCGYVLMPCVIMLFLLHRPRRGEEPAETPSPGTQSDDTSRRSSVASLAIELSRITIHLQEVSREPA